MIYIENILQQVFDKYLLGLSHEQNKLFIDKRKEKVSSIEQKQR